MSQLASPADAGSDAGPAVPSSSAFPLSERFTEATAYALAHHRDQRRKGGRVPYAAHLLAVAAIALEMECTEDEAIAALLHDVIEDGEVPLPRSRSASASAPASP